MLAQHKTLPDGKGAGKDWILAQSISKVHYVMKNNNIGASNSSGTNHPNISNNNGPIINGNNLATTTGDSNRAIDG